MNESDTADLSRALERLRESEARYRALAELSPVGAWVNVDGRFVYANAAAARMMGASSPEELIGLSASEVATEEYQPLIQERIAAVLHGGVDHMPPVETRWRRLDGTVFDVESRASAIPWEGKRAIQVVFHDITDRAQRDREQLRWQLAAAEEDERRRLARELHDEAGQHLTALGLGLQSLSDIALPGSEVDVRVNQLRRLADRLAQDLHGLALRLRPRALDDFGLEEALRAFVHEWSRNTGIAADLHVHLNAPRLPSAVESAVYRIVQEALTNIARHSGATSTSIHLERRDSQLVAIVEDNGRGFDAAAVTSGAAPGHGVALGLQGMQERVAMLAGTVEFESTARGGGTTVYVRIPLDEAGQPSRRNGRTRVPR